MRLKPGWAARPVTCSVSGCRIARTFVHPAAFSSASTLSTGTRSWYGSIAAPSRCLACSPKAGSSTCAAMPEPATPPIRYASEKSSACFTDGRYSSKPSPSQRVGRCGSKPAAPRAASRARASPMSAPTILTSQRARKPAFASTSCFACRTALSASTSKSVVCASRLSPMRYARVSMPAPRKTSCRRVVRSAGHVSSQVSRMRVRTARMSTPSGARGCCSICSRSPGASSASSRAGA
mmetsp:Transcript_65786/g.182303  ORF Transcript_65786/g.182303 Transcript_65786/m.182303 type:complete len:237 (+) Transcript_65786:115-825(+)